ncbi:MAG: DUF5615 family PIN-like protein, partial [Bacteroidota bacterium]
MKIRDLKWLVDENVHRKVVQFLSDENIDVLYVKDTDLRGQPDEIIMPWAYSEGRGLITHDSDFGTLAFIQREPFHAVLYLRPGHFDPNFTIESLEKLLIQDIDIDVPAILSVSRKA